MVLFETNFFKQLLFLNSNFIRLVSNQVQDIGNVIKLQNMFFSQACQNKLSQRERKLFHFFLIIFLSTMGNLIYVKNSSTKQNKPIIFDWKHEYLESNYQVVFDPNNMIRGQRYFLQCSTTQCESYLFRKQNHCFVVAVIDISYPSTYSICINSNKIQIVIQRIVRRYSDIKNAHYSQAIEIMEKALKGAAVIYQYVGGVIYNQKMLCFNQQSQLKIWLNQNLQINHSETQNLFISKAETIASIFNAVQSKISEIPLQYYQKKAKETCNSFQSALQFVSNAKKIGFFSNTKSLTIKKVIPLKKIYNNQQNQNLQRSDKTADNRIRLPLQIVQQKPFRQIQKIISKQSFKESKLKNSISLRKYVSLQKKQTGEIVQPIQPFAKRFVEQSVMLNTRNLFQDKDISLRVVKALNKPLVSEKFNNYICQTKQISFSADHSDYQIFKLDEKLDYEEIRKKIVSTYLQI